MLNKEKEVFAQKLDLDELDAVAGGVLGENGAEADPNSCVYSHDRDIYGGRGYPNCASTVEDGSRCSSSDACSVDAVVYRESIAGRMF